MSVNIFIITHNQVGQALVKTVVKTFGESLPISTTVVPVHYNTDPDQLINQLKQTIATLPADREIMVLTDMYGSTPCNIAKSLMSVPQHTATITGVNLPMLIRVMNYPDLSLGELTEKAISGGKDGVIQCQPPEDKA